MEVQMPYYSDAAQNEEEVNIRKGPWTAEEDSILSNYITLHGEGHWNSLARCAGLKRTGKSCRLRWLNYLRPNLRRGNITLQEQLLILELHSRWGNRWSKIAQQLPGRTDNEIKNYWRTRVQKQAKQLKCEVNSEQFRDAMRFVWIPRLVERIQAASGFESEPATVSTAQVLPVNGSGSEIVDPNCAMAASSDMSGSGSQVSSISDVTDCWNYQGIENGYSLSGDGLDFNGFEESNGWLGGEDSLELESLWNDENFWVFQEEQQSGDNVL